MNLIAQFCRCKFDVQDYDLYDFHFARINDNPPFRGRFFSCRHQTCSIKIWLNWYRNFSTRFQIRITSLHSMTPPRFHWWVLSWFIKIGDRCNHNSSVIFPIRVLQQIGHLSYIIVMKMEKFILYNIFDRPFFSKKKTRFAH